MFSYNKRTNTLDRLNHLHSIIVNILLDVERLQGFSMSQQIYFCQKYFEGIECQRGVKISFTIQLIFKLI